MSQRARLCFYKVHKARLVRLHNLQMQKAALKSNPGTQDAPTQNVHLQKR